MTLIENLFPLGGQHYLLGEVLTFMATAFMTANLIVMATKGLA